MLASVLYHALSAVDSSLYYYRHLFWNQVPDIAPKPPCGEYIDWTLEGSTKTNIEERIECFAGLTASYGCVFDNTRSLHDAQDSIQRRLK